MSEAPSQYWVRNQAGKTWGPLPQEEVHTAAHNGAFGPRVEISLDGTHFDLPGRFPAEVRAAFPQKMWGVRPMDNQTTTAPPRWGDQGAPPTLAAPGAAPAAQSDPVLDLAPDWMRDGASAAAPANPGATANPAPGASGATAAEGATPARVAGFQTSDTEVTAAVGIAAGLPHQGQLDNESTLALAYFIAAAQASGRLSLELRSGARYALTFKKGIVEHAFSTLPEDDVGPFLVRKGAVKPEQVSDAEVAKDGFGGDLLSALIGMRLMNPAETFTVLQEYALGVATRALLVDHGSYRWEPGITPPPSSFPMGTRWSLVCDSARRMDVVTVESRLGPRLHRAAKKSGGRVQITDLKLTPQEMRAYGAIDGLRSIAELAVSRPNEKDVIRRLGLLLAETELLIFGGERPVVDVGSAKAAAPAPAAPADEGPPAWMQAAQAAQAAAAPAGAAQAAAPALPEQHLADEGSPRIPAPELELAEISKPVPPLELAEISKPVPPLELAEISKPVPAPPPAAPAKPARAASPSSPVKAPTAAKPAAAKPAAAKPADDINSLRATLERIKAGDHFDVLGVPRTADGGKIKIAYLLLAKQYHPDSAAQNSTEEYKQLRADVFARIGEAWSIIGDESRREQYLSDLKSGGTAAVDVSRILNAEQIFQKGTLFVKARKYPEAIKQFDEAITLNPDEAEFLIWKIWSQFLIAANKKEAYGDAANAIESALKKNTRCAPGHLFLGQMCKLIGDLSGAEKHFKRGLGVDPNNGELQRELKYLRK